MIVHIRAACLLVPITKSCPRNCGFCIEFSKKGRRSAHVANLSKFWDRQLLVCPDHKKLILQFVGAKHDWYNRSH